MERPVVTEVCEMSGTDIPRFTERFTADPSFPITTCGLMVAHPLSGSWLVFSNARTNSVCQGKGENVNIEVNLGNAFLVANM